MDIELIVEVIAARAPEVAALGNWPSGMAAKAVELLMSRVPRDNVAPTAGFDSGIACCLDLIPRAKQCLAARLYGGRPPDAVEQVLRESVEMRADTETCWWLVAEFITRPYHPQIYPYAFLQQIRDFRNIADRPFAREDIAQRQRHYMSCIGEIFPRKLP